MKKVFILLFMATLVWPTTMQATIPPAKPVKDFKVKTSKSATRADDVKMGVVTELKYEKLPDMKFSRMGHQIFASGDALVVAGGHTTDYVPTKTAEIYRNGSWTELSIGSTHDNGFSAVLSDGTVMVGGGSSKSLGVGQSKAVDIYSPTTRSFTPGPDMSFARTLCKGLCIGNKLYVSGNWYADDVMIDYYDGSSFKPVGITDGRNSPYMMPDKNGNILIFGIEDTYGNLIDAYTYSDGSQGFLAERYDPSTGNTEYTSTIFSYSRLPLTLSNDIRPSDYHFMHNGENFYMILANEFILGEEDIYKLFIYCVEDDTYYQFGDFKIPSVHPETGEEISYRSGVLVNEAKREAYLIGSSVKQQIETVHIISMNYTTNEWTIASAPGFSYDLMQGAWTLLPDGRIACTGGFTDSSYHPSKEAYLFTPPTAGEESGDTPNPQKSGKTLVVLTKGGAKTEFLLSEKPKVLFEGKNLRITSSKADVTYALSDILRFTYENTDPTGINQLAETEDPTEVSYQDGTLVLSQLKEGAVVGVYSLDGKKVQQLRAGHKGTYRLSLSSLPKGVYIVKADTITYKIMKR